jgi:hypothetical protein
VYVVPFSSCVIVTSSGMLLSLASSPCGASNGWINEKKRHANPEINQSRVPLVSL